MWAPLLVMAVLGVAQVDMPSLAPAVFELDGYLDKAPEGETVQQRMVIGYGAKNREYLITKTRIEGQGDPGLLYKNLGMHKPDFILVGPEKPLEGLIDAKPGARVSGSFYFWEGKNTLEVDPRSIKVE